MGSGRHASCVRTCLLMRHTCNHFEPSLSCDLGKNCSCFDLSWQHRINKICTGNPICGLPHAADVEHVTNDYIRSLISEGSRPFVILPNKSLHFVSAFQQQLNGRTTCVSCGSGNQNRLRAAVGFDLISGCCINIHLLLICTVRCYVQSKGDVRRNLKDCGFFWRSLKERISGRD